VHSVYVGHATHLRSRMHSHGIGDNTTKRFMERCMFNGFEIWFRYYKKRSKATAERMEKHLMEKWWRYPWNKVGSPWHPTHR
jgi:GIY-YIG domain-containing protein